MDKCWWWATVVNNRSHLRVKWKSRRLQKLHIKTIHHKRKKAKSVKSFLLIYKQYARLSKILWYPLWTTTTTTQLSQCIWKEQQVRNEKLSEYLEKSIDLDDIGSQLLGAHSKLGKSGDKETKGKTANTKDDKKSESSSTGENKLERIRNGRSSTTNDTHDSKLTTSDSKEPKKKENKKNK